MSDFLSTLSAKNFPPSFFLANTTVPYLPSPRTLNRSRDDRDKGSFIFEERFLSGNSPKKLFSCLSYTNSYPTKVTSGVLESH